MKNIAITLIIFLGATITLAQENIPIGTWRVHFNYERTHLVELVEDKVYCANQFGLFYYDLSDNSLNKLSKIDGLSDISVSAMAYDGESKTFAIGYENGNLDLLQGNEVLNVKTIKNRDISDSKRINHITFRNGLVYLSTNFGVIVLDSESGEVLEAYQNLAQGESTKINGVTFYNNKIYAATNIGMLEGQIASKINLQDFNNWERFEGSEVSDVKIYSVTTLNDKVIATDGSKIYSFDGIAWADTEINNINADIIQLKVYGSNVIAITEEDIFSVDASYNVVSLAIENGDIPKDALLTSEGTLWYADYNKGMSKLENGAVIRFVPKGIFEGIVGRIQLVGEKIVVFPRFMSSFYQSLNNNLGYAEFENGSWQVFTKADLLELEDISAVSSDSKLIASFGDGILNQESQLKYDNTNSPLVKNNPSNNDILVAGLAVDSQGNTWVANASNTPLLKLDSEGNWESFSFGVSASEYPVDIKISNLGNVWMQLSNTFSGGILAYDPESKQSRYIASSNGNLPSSKVTDIAFAKDDEIWIGTVNGLAVFPFSFGVITDNSIEINRPIFGTNFLLENESISAIEIDGGNRKWIGTNDGLWLFDENADKLIFNFNTENSPLLSNNILDLKIHPTTGELFISTDKGLISYRSDASEGKPFHQHVKIFPNPVLPGFNGQVGISGLASNVVVKITNVSGRLVKELHAAGGSTSWNVADYNGVRAESGVYLVFSSSSDGKETFVGKIAIIN